jgi:hypothetical protein
VACTISSTISAEFSHVLHANIVLCVIRRKTDTGSDAKRTTFRSYPDKVPAESGHLT